MHANGITMQKHDLTGNTFELLCSSLDGASGDMYFLIIIQSWWLSDSNIKITSDQVIFLQSSNFNWNGLLFSFHLVENHSYESYAILYDISKSHDFI